jgi:hypothetical protein
MTFSIIVTIDRKNYRLRVERIHQTAQIERYRVTGGNRSIVLQTNGPLFKTKGLKHRKGQWKLVEGGAWNQHAIGEVCKMIQAYLDSTQQK